MERESIVPCVRLVRAIYDYIGENNDELCLKKGDVITVTQTPEGGWFEGTLRGMTGWFPCNYVEPIFDDENNDNNETEYDGDNDNLSIDRNNYNNVSESTQLDSQGNNCRSKIDQRVTNQMDNEENRKLVIKEIIQSEETYIKELTLIHQNILTPLIKSAVTPQHETATVVNSVVDILNVHIRFLDCLRSNESRPSRSIRIGGAFMEFAANIKSAHTKYCALHPHFIASIDQYKNEIMQLFKTLNIENGSVVLTSSLSFSFRRLDRYPALLQQLQRYTDEADPDRGDTQRAGFFYRDLVACCLEIRRHKNMELEVMTGNIKNWPSNISSVETFGPIIRMNQVTVTPPGLNPMKDRHLVLFEKYLLLLSVSREMTSFSFELCWSLSDVILVPRNNSQSNLVEYIIRHSTGSTGQSSSSLEDDGDKFNDVGKWTVAFANMELACDWFSALSECEFNYYSLERSIKESATNENLSTKPKVISESSSISSGGTGGLGKTPNSWSDSSRPNTGQVTEQQTMTPLTSMTVTSPYISLNGYWNSNSVLPHQPLKLPDVNLGKKSAKDPSGSVRPSSPADDMAILAVIESYCSGGGKRKPTNANIPTKQESNGSRNGINSGLSDEFKNIRVEDLAMEVKSLRGEVKQLRSDLDLVLSHLKIQLPLQSK